MKRLFLIIVCILTLFFTGCQPKTSYFNIASYIQIQEEGYEDYGHIQANFNYDKLYSDFISQFKKANIEKENLRELIKISVPNAENLNNDDTVNIQIVADSSIENVLREDINMTLLHTMSNLQARMPYNPFDDLQVNTQGIHPAGTVQAHIEHYGQDASWEWPVLVISPTETVANGDIITLQLDVDINSVEKQYGIDITTSEIQYTVETLTSRLESTKDLQNISEENLRALNRVIEDWVVSGENDENSGGWTRTYEFETAILLTKESDSRIFFIYHIEDGYVPSGYYVYISPTYTVLADNKNHTLITGDHRPLSNSFAKYDKDTVRYTEKWGWGQDYERQGFMYRDVPYAGKATLEDMITYLTSYYSDYPIMYQLN